MIRDPSKLGRVAVKYCQLELQVNFQYSKADSISRGA